MLVIAYASLIGLLRDRGALVMAFVLPAVIFMIFAAVFSGTQGDGFDIKVAYSDQTLSGQAARIADALIADGELGFVSGGAPEDLIAEDAARAAVTSGRADAAILILSPITAAGGPAPASMPSETTPVVIVSDPAKPLAGALAAASVQRALVQAVPGAVAPPLVSIEAIDAEEQDPAVAYYAGAIAIMFLFFAALQGAVGLIEDRDSGIIDRLMLTRGGAGALVAGKYLFLTAQGIVQALIVFVVAWAGYAVVFFEALPAFALTTLLAATTAAGLAMAVVSVATSRAQALAVGNAIVLIMSAVGGSMVPRYMMPEWIQSLGALTPSGWVINAYQAVLFRDVAAADLGQTWLLLAAFSFAAFIFAWMTTRMKERAG